LNVSFLKLQVSGDDFILIDRDRPGHEIMQERPDALPHLAAAICDRRRGAGARGAAFVSAGCGKQGALCVRLFDARGEERKNRGDALLCVSRWASDSGRAVGGKVRIDEGSGELTVSAIDSRTFAVEPPAPLPEKEPRIELLLDGLPETAYLFRGSVRWAATIGKEGGPSPKRVREALAAAVPDAVPVIARPASRDLIRFSTIIDADRVGAAAAAVAAGRLAGKTDDSAVAEWRGKGAAVAFADFGPGAQRGKRTASSGPEALIDRGRFFVEWKSDERVFVAGIAEYVYEGSYDFFA